MDIWKSISGMVELSVASADIPSLLEQINCYGISLFHVQEAEFLTARFCIFRKDYPYIAGLCKKRGDQLKIIARKGLYWPIQQLLRRPVLLGSIILALLFALWIPTRVFFVKVEGNNRIASNQILEAAQSIGIHFGTSRRAVRSERVKNALISSLPELQWVGVNTNGCVATISVREKQYVEKEEENYGIRNVIAGRDGIILNCTATQGNLLCAEGQAVKKGQVLISGYRDCGIYLQVSQAEGEVFAQTRRHLTALTPSAHMVRQERKSEKKRYSLLIGKKRIFLWKGSGIWDSTCGRMYKEYYMTLPGGFQLPVGIGVDEVSVYESALLEKEPKWVESLLYSTAQKDLTQQMIAGTIADRQEKIISEEGVFLMEGEYVCTEMIGRVQWEQIGEQNG